MDIPVGSVVIPKASVAVSRNVDFDFLNPADCRELPYRISRPVSTVHYDLFLSLVSPGTCRPSLASRGSSYTYTNVDCISYSKIHYQVHKALEAMKPAGVTSKILAGTVNASADRFAVHC